MFIFLLIIYFLSAWVNAYFYLSLFDNCFSSIYKPHLKEEKKRKKETEYPWQLDHKIFNVNDG